MSDLTPDSPRPRRRVSHLIAPPNQVPCGRPIAPPAGVRAWPGPAKVIRHKQYLHVRIEWQAASQWLPAEWRASVLATLPDCGLVACGPNLDTLKVYLLDRFSPCWFTVIPGPEDSPSPS